MTARTDLTWWWEATDASGDAVEPKVGTPRFPNRSDAETWIGEIWQDLADEGIVAVTLYDGDREVYGPMSLAAE